MDPDFILEGFNRASDNADLAGIFCFDSDVGEQQQLNDVHIIEGQVNNDFDKENVTTLAKGKKKKVNPSIQKRNLTKK